MRLPERVRDAAGMTAVAYGFRTASALLLTWPALADLARALAAHTYRAELSAAELAPLLELVSRNARPYALWAVATLTGYALLSPLVSLAWLHALARPQSIPSALARATASYLPSLALTALALLAAAATLALALLALHPALAALLPGTAAAESLWTALTLCLAALAILAIATAHDLARAALARTASLRAALGALRALTPRLLAQHALFAVCAASAALLAEAAARTFPALPHALLLPTQQALVFIATLLRACWLAVAVSHAIRRV